MHLHTHIRDKAPPVGAEPESTTHAAQNVTQLTKYESHNPAILNIYRSRRYHVLSDLADIIHFAARPAGILTDLTDIAHFWRDRRGWWEFSPILTDLAENRR